MQSHGNAIRCGSPHELCPLIPAGKPRLDRRGSRATAAAASLQAELLRPSFSAAVADARAAFDTTLDALICGGTS